jgi:uncharacterized 2Fe-2S/4Fe-4S cluster protein (DUF4445 family)
VDVDKIYLAGGFGLWLKEKSALATGLLPREFAGRISAVGNTSLAGAVLLVQNWEHPKNVLTRYDRIAGSAEIVHLAGSDEFASRFIDNMEL